MNLRNVTVAVILIALILGIVVFILSRQETEEQIAPVETPIAEELPSPELSPFTQETIGNSVEGRAIEAYTFGSGPTHLLFVGGIHGGYEWNSVLLAYEAVDYLTNNPEVVPEELSVTIVPSANPDGVFKIVGKEGRFTTDEILNDANAAAGRFNANKVDLNRNFDCKWQPESTWRSQVVSAGSAPFSEPEAAALRDFINRISPAAVIFWHSQSNAVYASECEDGILPETRTLMNTYAQAAEYPAVDTFSAYSVTGDAEGWLASIGVPAITVELSTHGTIEWDKNLAGMNALFAHYKNEQTGVAR